MLHFLLHGRYEARMAALSPPEADPAPAPEETACILPDPVPLPPPEPVDRLEQVWPLLQADLTELCDVVHPLTPNGELKAKLIPSVLSRQCRA